MEKHDIYYLAYAELLRRHEQESRRPDGPIKRHRLAKYEQQINELNDEIKKMEEQEKKMKCENCLHWKKNGECFGRCSWYRVNTHYHSICSKFEINQ